MATLETPHSFGYSNIGGLLSAVNWRECQDPASQQQAATLALARRLNSQQSVSALYHDAAALIAEALHAEYCSVGELSANGQELTLNFASYDFRGSLTNPTAIKLSMRADESMAARALINGNVIWCPDLIADRSIVDYYLRKFNIRASLTVPAIYQGRPIGVLGAYSRSARNFRPDELQFAETLALMLGAAISRGATERELADERRFSGSLASMIEELVFILDAQGNIQHMNPAAQRLSGFPVERVRDKPFVSQFIKPRDTDSVWGALRRCSRDRVPAKLQSEFLTKDGSLYRMEWFMQPISGDSVEVPATIILVGTDLSTDAAQSEELNQLRNFAAEAMRRIQSGGLSGDESARIEALLMKIQRRTEDIPAVESRAQGATAMQSVPQSYTQPVSAPLASPQPGYGSPAKVEEPANAPSSTPAAAEPHQPSGIDLRRSERHNFIARQLIAPIRDGILPKAEQFYEVVCKDISEGGVAFALTKRPDFDSLVIALGGQADSPYLAAQIVNIREKTNDGKTFFIVGCRFTGRVSISS